MNETVTYIETQLSDIYSPAEAREMAFWLLEEMTGLPRALISARKDTKIISDIEIILQRLRKKEPIQYIFGHTLWMGLDLSLNPSTLIPRPETAELVQWILDTMPKQKPLSIVDIGTGSGCIAIALKQRRPNWKVTGIDISENALTIAKQNAERNHVDVSWMQKDILSDEIGNFDIIVSNPPYVLESEKATMDSNVLDYEPPTALFVPDNDPLKFYRRIISLKSGKCIFFEVNERFANQVAELFNNHHYHNISIKTDIYEKQRMVSGRIEE